MCAQCCCCCVDAIGTKRYDARSGGEKEIQRTMLELLNQLDGFDSRADVKVLMATNRIESLDPALIRPGRIDRKIEFPLPDAKTKRRIFHIHTSKMTLADDVHVDEFVTAKDELSGADIKALCTGASAVLLSCVVVFNNVEISLFLIYRGWSVGLARTSYESDACRL